MATTAQFSKTVTEGTVSFKNLVIDPKKKTFTMDYAIIEGRKRKFNYQTISGSITYELYDWFTKSFTDNTDETGATKTTAFKKYLERKMIDYAPGIVRTLEWTSQNRSMDFDDCPFRLTISNTYNHATLNLVYKFPKVVKSISYDAKGQAKKLYGYKRFANMKKEYFRRLEIFNAL